MARSKREDSLSFQLRHACDGIANDNTRKAYQRGAQHFAEYLRGDGLRHASQIAKGDVQQLLQGFCDALNASEKPYSDSTIDNYVKGALYAINNTKGTSITASDVSGHRRLSRPSKGRKAELNRQGKIEAVEARYGRLVDVAGAIGLRRSEYKRLTGRDYRPDESGYMCIFVRGKGGKMQAQRILPQHQSLVAQEMGALKPNEHLFTPKELNNKIDLHALRRRVAKQAYAHYAFRIANEPGYADKLRGQLIARYDAMHPLDPNQKKAAADRNAYIRDLTDYRGTYVVRGSNAAALRDRGRDTSFDRLAVMAVSVFHLSHWRADVTVKHYLI